MIPSNIKLEMRLLHQTFKLKIADIVKKYQMYPRSSIYRICKQNVNQIDQRMFNGCPSAITERTSRRIQSAVAELRAENGNSGFSAQDVRVRSGVVEVSRRTVSRHLNHLGYRVRHLRKKGILSKADKVKRLCFSRREKMRDASFFKEKIFLYFDGVSFAYKKNPMLNAMRTGTMGYRKSSEGCSVTCAGAKEGTGGKCAHYYVGISYGEGVSLCLNKGTEKLNGDKFALMVKEHFPHLIEKLRNKGKLCLMDNCPVQNSKKAKDAFAEVQCNVYSIPPRSPDLNPIENIFSIVRRNLRKEAIAKKITSESFNSFCQRVEATFYNISKRVVNNCIGSMPKRLDLVYETKGNRINY